MCYNDFGPIGISRVFDIPPFYYVKIIPKMIEVKLTDKVFYDSPNAGDPDCLCSRCLKAIREEDEPIIRAWPTEEGDHGFDPKGDGGTEFRYCHACCAQMGVHYSKGTEDDFDPNFNY